MDGFLPLWCIGCAGVFAMLIETIFILQGTLPEIQRNFCWIGCCGSGGRMGLVVAVEGLHCLLQLFQLLTLLQIHIKSCGFPLELQ